MENLVNAAKNYAGNLLSNITQFNGDHSAVEKIVTEAFMAGAMTQKFASGQWNNSKNELPDVDTLVLVKTDTGEIMTAFYKYHDFLKSYYWVDRMGYSIDVKFWRYIE